MPTRARLGAEFVPKPLAVPGRRGLPEKDSSCVVGLGLPTRHGMCVKLTFLSKGARLYDPAQLQADAYTAWREAAAGEHRGLRASSVLPDVPIA